MTAQNYQELHVACRLNGITRETLDAYLSQGDAPRIFVVAGVVVVHADEFRQWAMRINIDERREACRLCD